MKKLLIGLYVFGITPLLIFAVTTNPNYSIAYKALLYAVIGLFAKGVFTRFDSFFKFGQFCRNLKQDTPIYFGLLEPVAPTPAEVEAAKVLYKHRVFNLGAPGGRGRPLPGADGPTRVCHMQLQLLYATTSMWLFTLGLALYDLVCFFYIPLAAFGFLPVVLTLAFFTYVVLGGGLYEARQQCSFTRLGCVIYKSLDPASYRYFLPSWSYYVALKTELHKKGTHHV